MVHVVEMVRGAGGQGMLDKNHSRHNSDSDMVRE